MQFKAISKEEFDSTIKAIFDSGVYDFSISTTPVRYPCIVVIDVDGFETKTNKIDFTYVKYIYTDSLVYGYVYQEKLKELIILDGKLEYLNTVAGTSGNGINPLLEYDEVSAELRKVEEILF